MLGIYVFLSLDIVLPKNSKKETLLGIRHEVSKKGSRKSNREPYHSSNILFFENGKIFRVEPSKNLDYLYNTKVETHSTKFLDKIQYITILEHGREVDLTRIFNSTYILLFLYLMSILLIFIYIYQNENSIAKMKKIVLIVFCIVFQVAYYYMY